jgi:hypothetical protein
LSVISSVISEDHQFHTLLHDDISAECWFTPFDIALPLEYASYLISLKEFTNHPHAAAFRDWLMEEAGLEDESGQG